jgi:hypothetical protein
VLWTSSGFMPTNSARSVGSASSLGRSATASRTSVVAADRLGAETEAAPEHFRRACAPRDNGKTSRDVAALKVIHPKGTDRLDG